MSSSTDPTGILIGPDDDTAAGPAADETTVHDDFSRMPTFECDVSAEPEPGCQAYSAGEPAAPTEPAADVHAVNTAPPGHREIGVVVPAVLLVAMSLAVTGFSVVLLHRRDETVTVPSASTTVTSIIPAPLTVTSVVPPPPPVTISHAPATVTRTVAPAPAPTTPSAPVTPYAAPRAVPGGDDAFIATLRNAGVAVYNRDRVIFWGHRTCELARSGQSTEEIQNQLLAEGNAGTEWTATVAQIVTAAQFSYPDCTARAA